MRKAVALIAGVLVLVAVNWSVMSRERLLAEGRVVLLDLGPVDPRSLMQGDYMALRFPLANQLSPGKDPADGRIVVTLDDKGVARFVRRDQGTPLAPGEVALRYRIRNGEVRFATNAFYFQEGTGDTYARARFGEFRVDGDGEMILKGMRGADYMVIR